MDKSLTLVDKAHKLHQHLLELRGVIESNFLEMAGTLKQIRDEKLYELLDYKTFESYIATPEVSLDRSNVYKLIKVYETFIEKYNVAPAPLLRAGWDKLARIEPYVGDDDYEFYLEKAETLSRSDLNEVLIEHGFITKKEAEQAKFVEVDCPRCHEHFVWNLTKRANQEFPREDYTKVIEAYEKAKDTKFKGDEYRPIQQAIKTMFMNGRTPDQIIAAIKHEAETAEYSWTIRTIQNKIAEILPQIEPKVEKSEFQKKWEK